MYSSMLNALKPSKLAVGAEGNSGQQVGLEGAATAEGSGELGEAVGGPEDKMPLIREVGGRDRVTLGC